MKWIHYKTYCFFILILLLIVVIFKNFSANSTNIDLPKFYLENEKTDNLVNAVIVNNQQIVYDKDENLCYVSNIAFLENNKITALSSYGKVKIYLEDIDGNKKLVAYNDKYYQIIDIIVTNIPIISIHNLDIPKNKNLQFNNKIIEEKNNYSNENSEISNIGIQYFNNTGSNIKSTAQMNVRGASSQVFEKKAYKLKFPHKIQLLNTYKDNTWALDALFTDKSKIRNKISSDMWNIINNNQKINNDLYGDFCELFIDDEYIGLYVLKNKVNKDITNVTDDGILIKSIAILREDYVEKLLNNKHKITNGFFLNYEIKKYSENGFQSIIANLKDYYKDYYETVDYETVYRNYDIDNYINFRIFVSLIGGNDNVTYNQYISLSNSTSKILTTPWDMDLTWGLNWSDDAELHSIFSMESSYDNEWMNQNITRNMDEKTLNLMKQRYWELRQNTITIDNINNYLNSYKEILVNSGAAKRDSERWYEYDVEYEIEQIREWAIRRINFLDNYFK